MLIFVKIRLGYPATENLPRGQIKYGPCDYSVIESNWFELFPVAVQ